ncbi:MAG: hypothetical protein R3C18_03005 [Planctomycetaceae bacterium]
MNLVNTQFDPSERVPGELDYLGYDGSSLNFCFDDVIEGIRSLDGAVWASLSPGGYGFPMTTSKCLALPFVLAVAHQRDTFATSMANVVLFGWRQMITLKTFLKSTTTADVIPKPVFSLGI